MALTYKIWDFPSVAIKSQLFHVPGIAYDGGYTSGGARIVSPEPGGRSVLEMGVALRIDEWNFPFASWLASKANGEIFKIQMVKTPQLVSTAALLGNDPSFGGLGGVLWNNNALWDNDQKWADDGVYVNPNATALEGSTTLTLDMGSFGEVIKHGHVIGHDNYSYVVDDITYSGSVATLTVKPPLRKNIAVNDFIWFRPFFLGMIANGDQVKALYTAENIGNIELGKIIFQEVILG